MATTFEVKVKDKKGKTYFKTMKADNVNQVKQKLREANYTVMGIKEKGVGTTSRGGAGEAAAGIGAKLSKMMGGSVQLKDLTIFSRQFATMINAGVSMVRSLGILAEQSESKLLMKCLFEIKDQVE